MSVVSLLLAVGSLSARRAWIEIKCQKSRACTRWVALRKESVDRNYGAIVTFQHSAGSLSARRAWIEMRMDVLTTFPGLVALRKESVDRNLLMWYQCNTVVKVALRKESVDRNHDDMLRYRDAEQSLSARRAWIEMPWLLPRLPWLLVALRKESVDRNLCMVFFLLSVCCRSPQGERG